jgi:cilia- and flagella-associated protein 52
MAQVKIQALDFSHDEQYLASLGGPDDNSLVMWDVTRGEAMCGSPTHSNFTMCVKFFNHDSHKLVTAGNYNLHVWGYDIANNKLRQTEATLGQLQRIFKSICVDSRDAYAYCGTTSGDVLQVALQGPAGALFRNSGPAKDPIQVGATASAEAPNGDLMVGGGDGSVSVLRTAPEASPANPKLLKKMPRLASVKLEGGVSSIALDLAGSTARAAVFLVGTVASNMYKVTYEPATARCVG